MRAAAYSGASFWISAGDLMMMSVLLRLKSSDILDKYPNLAAQVARGEKEPNCEQAFAAQRAVNIGAAG